MGRRGIFPLKPDGSNLAAARPGHSPRHARPADSQGAQLGPGARLRRRALDPARHRRCARRRRGFALSRTAPARRARAGSLHAGAHPRTIARRSSMRSRGADARSSASKPTTGAATPPPFSPRSTRRRCRSRRPMARWSRFRRLFGPEPKADVDAELSFHLEMRVRELIEQGVPPERARTLALRRFGDYEQPRAACVAISKRRERRMARTRISRPSCGRTSSTRCACCAARPASRSSRSRRWRSASAPTAPSSASSRACCSQPLPFRDAERLYRVTTLYPDGTHHIRSRRRTS